MYTEPYEAGKTKREVRVEMLLRDGHTVLVTRDDFDGIYESQFMTPLIYQPDTAAPRLIEAYNKRFEGAEAIGVQIRERPSRLTDSGAVQLPSVFSMHYAEGSDQ